MRILFVSNKEDNNHCLQASLIMAAAVVGHAISWEEVDRLTSYEEGLYTWAATTIASFSKIVPNSKLVSPFDYQAFSEQGESYLRQAWPLEWFEIQKTYASPRFKKEQEATTEALEMGLIEYAQYQIQDLESLLEDNFLIALVDAGALAGEDYLSAHWVFIYDCGGKNFIVHDPGLPAHKKWKLNKHAFISAFQGDVIVVPKRQ